jgi:alpha-L-arabinofuranosidase
LEIKGVDALAAKTGVITLAADPADTNSIDQPRNVVPKTTIVRNLKPAFTYTLPPHSIVILKLKTRS